MEGQDTQETALQDRSEYLIDIEFRGGRLPSGWSVVYRLARLWNEPLENVSAAGGETIGSASCCPNAAVRLRYKTRKDDLSPMRTVWEALLALSENVELAFEVKNAIVSGPQGEVDATGFGFERACSGRERWVTDPIRSEFDPGDVFWFYIGGKPRGGVDWMNQESGAKNARGTYYIDSDAIERFLKGILMRRFERNEDNLTLKSDLGCEQLQQIEFDWYYVQCYSARAVKEMRADVVSLIAQLEYISETSRVEGCQVWLKGGLQNFEGLDDELRPRICKPWELPPDLRCTIDQALSFYRRIDRMFSGMLEHMDPEGECLYVSGP